MDCTTLEQLIGREWGQEGLVAREALAAYQCHCLAQVVAHCRERSRWYRDRLAQAGFGKLRELADLCRLPFTTEEDIRQHGLEMLCVSQDEVARIITMQSSGTTGAPKRLYFTAEDLDRTVDFFAIGMQTFTRPGDRVAILLPGSTPDSTGYLLATALARFGARSDILGLVGDPAEAGAQLAALQPEIVVGFPVQILAIARLAAMQGMSLSSVRAVLLCSDYVPESLCQQLQQVLPCEVFMHYGTVETGLGGGVDCQAHQGTHLREADLLVEIIDPQTTAPLADGQWGEVVFTTLRRRGMPLIRYRTGDYGRLLAGPCGCGSSIRRLDKILGRLSQVRTLASGRRLGLNQLDEVLFAIPGLLDFSAQVLQEDDQEVLAVTLKVLPGYARVGQKLAREALRHRAELSATEVRVSVGEGSRIQLGKRILEDLREGVLV